MTWNEFLGPYQRDGQLLSDTFMLRWSGEPWNPSADDRAGAAKLHTQITSRITTQRLGYLESLQQRREQRDRGLSRSHFRFCRIRYPKAGRNSEELYGYLLYLKLSLTGNEGEFLRRYRLDEPVFPHHSTADQLFSETQFEAYRSLGEHIGDKLFLRALVNDLADSKDVQIEDWFEALGRNLLEPLPAANMSIPTS